MIGALGTAGQDALWTMILVSAPLLGVALVVGVVISVMQAATQVSEMTLSFVPKFLAVLAVLFLAGPWMMGVMERFTVEALSTLPGMLR